MVSRIEDSTWLLTSIFHSSLKILFKKSLKTINFSPWIGKPGRVWEDGFKTSDACGRKRRDHKEAKKLFLRSSSFESDLVDVSRARSMLFGIILLSCSPAASNRCYPSISSYVFCSSATRGQCPSFGYLPSNCSSLFHSSIVRNSGNEYLGMTYGLTLGYTV